MKLHHYTNTIKYLYYILFFVLPFVVLPVNSELFEFNKILFIYLIATLICGVWLLRSFQEKRFAIRRTPLDIPIGIFLVSQIISALLSIDQHTSFFGYYGRFNGGLLSILTYIFLYYGFVSNIEKNKNKVIKAIFGISAISSLLVVLWGLPGTFNHDLSCLLFTSKFDNTCWTAQFRPAERMFSTLGQPNWLGAYLSITFFIGIFLSFTSQSKKWRLIGIIGVLSSYVGILLSRSRSSMGSLVPGTILLSLYLLILFLNNKHWFSSFKKKLLLIFLGGLIVITFITKTGIPQVDSLLTFSFLKKQAPAPIAVTAPVEVTKSLEVVGGITESLDIRKIVWKGAWELGMQYPLFGTGVETFGYAYYSVRPVAHNLTSEWDYLYNKAHNEYLNLLATTGWFGLGSYVLLMMWMGGLIILRIIKYKSDTTSVLFYLALIGIYISICITNFFGFSITVINTYWYLTLGFLVLYGEPDSIPNTNHNRVSLAQTGIAILVVLWLLNSIGTYWVADFKYAQSDAALKSNNTEASVRLLQEALALRDEHVYEDKLSYALAQYAYLASYQKQKDKAIEMIDIAEKLNLKSIKSSPQNVLYWKTRVKNQFIFYQMSLDKKYLFTGLAALDEATKLASTDPKIPYFSATYYSLLYDDEKDIKQKKLFKDKSMESIEKAIALKPDYGDAFYLKVQLLKKYGNKVEGKKLLEWYIPRFAPTNEEIKKELSSF
ncbi:MAG: O-antigen ligase family protein [Candidatus Roizmanbacteria bacterium]|nr:O-antigen ligase family protein [Candidatus Roizmanbacteria bacterium]